MPRRKNGEDSASTSSGMPVLSEDLAALLNSKIKEFESVNEKDSEKKLKENKGKARAVAKNKLKEAKQIIGTDSPGSEKVRQLWERLQRENEEAEKATKESLARQKEIADSEQERDVGQAELNRALAVKGKLESLCEQLRKQTNQLADERRRMSDMERQKRQELADEFQATITDVKKKMEQQANERSRLARENEELRGKFKKFFEQYDQREKERLEQQQQRDLEVQLFETRLREQAQLYRVEAQKEQAAQRENDELNSTEQALRGQLQTYSSKFSQFQDALSKSDKVLGQYKRQRNKMQRRVEVLEKENSELRNRNERKATTVTKDRDSALKEKEMLQERCKALQAERSKLTEEVQRLKESAVGGG